MCTRSITAGVRQAISAAMVTNVAAEAGFHKARGGGRGSAARMRDGRRHLIKSARVDAK